MTLTGSSTTGLRGIGPPLKALLALALVAVIAGVALLYNAPAAKTLRFEIACERFPVVTPLLLDLNQQGTQLQGVLADGFSVRATNAETVTLRIPKRREVRVPGGTLTLSLTPVEGPSLNSHVNLVRRRVVQNLELSLEATAELMATTTVGPDLPWLTVVSKTENDAALIVRGLEVDIIEGNRYRVEEIDASQVVDVFSATLIGSLSGKMVEAKLNSSSRARTYAALMFARTPSSSLPLLKGVTSIPGDSRLEFIRAVNPNLRLGERRIDGIAADQPVNLAAMVSATTIEEIRLVNDADRRGLPALVVSGHATARSLQLDGRELMPTRLDEILNASVSDRTLPLLLLGMLAAALLKVLDRALSVLLEYALPKKD